MFEKIPLLFAYTSWTLLRWGNEQMVPSNSSNNKLKSTDDYLDNLGRVIKEFIKFIDFRQMEPAFSHENIVYNEFLKRRLQWML